MVREQDDFYAHVNAEWLEANPVPGDYSRWGTFEELNKVNEEQLRGILGESGDDKEWGCVQTLWRQGQDEARLNNEKFSEVLSDFIEKISCIETTADLTDVLMYWFYHGITCPVSMGAHPDLKNSDLMILAIDRSGLGLPDRDMYFLESMAEKRAAYKDYLKSLSAYASSEVTADYIGDTDLIYQLEETLAEACLTKVERRDPNVMYNPHNLEQLVAVCPAIDWAEYLSDVNIDLKGTFCVVKEIEFMKRLDKCIKETPLAIWQHYLLLRLVSCTAPHLNDKGSLMRHGFYGKVMSGQTDQKPRWKRVYHAINSSIGQIVGKRYVARHFPAESKAQVLDMIQRMMGVLKSRIKSASWMQEDTKAAAIKKLGTIVVKIGYPDKWEDYSELSLSSESYCLNMIECDRWDTVKDLRKCYKPVDKTEWHMTPQTVNAYYNPCQNEIVFPAGIIQPPMYGGDLAANFGGIGAVICHEITHGFDDKGALFDHNGNLENWWTDEDKANFELAAEKVKLHFSEYVVEGMNVNGELCLGENIADLGGLGISLEALRLYLEETDHPDSDGELKKVFYNWATIWRNNIKPDEAKKRIVTDPHSPGHVRVNGIVKNIPAFYQLFNVSEGDEMFLAPDKRGKIW